MQEKTIQQNHMSGRPLRARLLRLPLRDNRRATHNEESMVQIRRFEPSDAEAVSNVIRTTMRISNAADYPMERLQPLIDYFSPAKVEQLSHERDCLVAEEKGEIIGTAALEGDELVTFFVNPQLQGRGIGSALLKEIEAIALRHGRRELKVDASLAGTPFYERHGYERTGHVMEGTAGPQIFMRKQLRSTPPT